MSTTPSKRGIAPESATSRLSRLLTMVPWLMNRQGIDIEQAAQTLGVSTKQIEADLQLLFVCGTPGHMPDDLIEAEWEEGRVFVRNADEIARPLRFNRDEALALTVGLRALLEVPGLTERDAVDRALAKLVEAAGESSAGADRVSVTFDHDGDVLLETLRTAIEHRQRVHLRYLVPSRDEVTERDVDPMRLLNNEGHWYLEGWCHRADDVRLFRTDRIEEIDVLEHPAQIPERAQHTDLRHGFFAPEPDAVGVRLRLHAGAHWVAEYYPCHDVVHDGDDLEATFYTGDDSRWLVQLLLRLGDSASILGPASVAEQVAERARAALENYEAS